MLLFFPKNHHIFVTLCWIPVVMIGIRLKHQNRCSPMKGFPFGRLFLFILECRIIRVVRSSGIERL